MMIQSLKPAHFHSEISHFQEVPKKFVKECHQSNNDQNDRTEPLFLVIYSPTSQTLADLNNFTFSISKKANFCKKDLKSEKNLKVVARIRTWY